MVVAAYQEPADVSWENKMLTVQKCWYVPQLSQKYLGSQKYWRIGASNAYPVNSGKNRHLV